MRPDRQNLARTRLECELGHLLVIGGAAGAYFAGLLDPLLGGDESQAGEDGIPQDAVFYDMEELLVSLSTAGREAAFLKIKISLELEKLEAEEEE